MDFSSSPDRGTQVEILERTLRDNSNLRDEESAMLQEISVLTALVDSLRTEKESITHELMRTKPDESYIVENASLRDEIEFWRLEAEKCNDLLNETRDNSIKEMKAIQRFLRDDPSSTKLTVSDAYKMRRQDVAELSEKLARSSAQRDEFAKAEARSHASMITAQKAAKEAFKDRESALYRVGELESRLKKERLKCAWLATVPLRSDPTAAQTIHSNRLKLEKSGQLTVAASGGADCVLPASERALEEGLKRTEQILSEEPEDRDKRESRRREFAAELEAFEERLAGFAGAGEQVQQRAQFVYKQKNQLEERIKFLSEQAAISKKEITAWRTVCGARGAAVRDLATLVRETTIPLLRTTLGVADVSVSVPVMQVTGETARRQLDSRAEHRVASDESKMTTDIDLELTKRLDFLMEIMQGNATNEVGESPETSFVHEESFTAHEVSASLVSEILPPLQQLMNPILPRSSAGTPSPTNSPARVERRDVPPQEMTRRELISLVEELTAKSKQNAAITSIKESRISELEDEVASYKDRCEKLISASYGVRTVNEKLQEQLTKAQENYASLYDLALLQAETAELVVKPLVDRVANDTSSQSSAWHAPAKVPTPSQKLISWEEVRMGVPADPMGEFNKPWLESIQMGLDR